MDDDSGDRISGSIEVIEIESWNEELDVMNSNSDDECRFKSPIKMMSVDGVTTPPPSRLFVRRVLQRWNCRSLSSLTSFESKCAFAIRI